MREVFIATVFVAFAILSTPVAAVELPKCRNVAGYEPRPTCQARNQRAHWQAEETARLTAQQFARVLAARNAAEQANKNGIFDQVKKVTLSAVEAVMGLFN